MSEYQVNQPLYHTERKTVVRYLGISHYALVDDNGRQYIVRPDLLEELPKPLTEKEFCDIFYTARYGEGLHRLYEEVKKRGLA